MSLGDGAFSMKPWMWKPFGNAVLTEKKRYFNYHLNHTHMVSEGAFDELKGRFTVFHKNVKAKRIL